MTKFNVTTLTDRPNQRNFNEPIKKKGKFLPSVQNAGKYERAHFDFAIAFVGRWENLSHKVSETLLTSYFPVIPYGNPFQGYIVNHQIKAKEARG